ncbi:MAG: aldehyde dehydrogenase family protein, partial [Acidobacteria bacterium]|nr:aldehyde dehydrogenase family protein [Acidobacteriota bacterium]
MEKKKLLIGGKWVESAIAIEVRSPFNGKYLAEVCTAGADEIAMSLSFGIEAASRMRSLGRFQIASGLRKIAESLKARRDEFASCIAREAAKPISLARGEAERAAATFAWAAGEAERFVGRVVPIDTQASGKGKLAWTTRVARGLIYGITPFNFPLNLVAHKVAPALASGNAIIIKPSPRTPLTALLLGEVFLESGLPSAALQVVPADIEFVDKIIADHRIAMISFT